MTSGSGRRPGRRPEFGNLCSAGQPGGVRYPRLARVVHPWHDGLGADGGRTGTRLPEAWLRRKEVVLCQVVVTRIVRAGWSNGRVTGGPLMPAALNRTPGAYLTRGFTFFATDASAKRR